MRIKPLLLCLAILLGFSFLPIGAQATPSGYHNCAQATDVCTDSKARVIDGFTVNRACWKWKRVYHCDRKNRLDYCAAIDATEGCVESGNKKCIARTSTGFCTRYSLDYVCGIKVSRGGGVVYLDSQYTITSDKTVSECTSEEANDQCFIASETCTAPNQTRIINGESIFKKCWAWTRNYNCLQSSMIHDCDTLIANKDCTEGAAQCLAYSGKDDKICVHRERQFSCKSTVLKETGETICAETSWCAGGLCAAVDRVANTGFGDAISSLNAAFAIGAEVSAGGNPVRLFKGRVRACRKWPNLDAGLRNCCADKGALKGVVHCKASEIELAAAVQSQTARHYKSYCARKNILGMCDEKKSEYCVFDTRLARTVIEAAHQQLSLAWPTACNGLPPDRLKEIDFSKVNWSEVFGGIYDNLTLPDQEKFQEQAVKRVEDFYKEVAAELEEDNSDDDGEAEE